MSAPKSEGAAHDHARNGNPRHPGHGGYHSRCPHQFGQPVPNVHVDDHPNDAAMREHGYAAGESVYHAVDATAAFRRIRLPATSEAPA